MPRTSEPFDGLYPDTPSFVGYRDQRIVDAVLSHWPYGTSDGVAEHFAQVLKGALHGQGLDIVVRENITPEGLE